MNKVDIHPFPVIAGERVEVNYNGLLVDSGADPVYLHSEMTTSKDMKEIRDIRMHYTDQGWQVEVSIPPEYEKFNLSFKDAANNLDDNDGQSWTYTIIHK